MSYWTCAACEQQVPVGDTHYCPQNHGTAVAPPPHHDETR